MSADEPQPPLPTSPTLWRRVAASSWAEPTSPVVYARVKVDVTDIEVKLKELSKKTGKRVTLTSLVSWALAKAIADNPDCNAIVRAGELKQLPSVNINVAVALPESDTVWPCKLPNADKMNILEVADKIKKDKESIHTHQAAKLHKYSMVDWLMPASIVRLVVNTATTLETDWGVNLSWIGVDNIPFQPASATITCNHHYGIEEAFATFPTMQPTPLIVSVGLVREIPWVVNGAIVPRRVVSLCFTVDHRVMDGKLGGKLMKSVRRHLYSFVKSPMPEELPRAKL